MRHFPHTLALIALAATPLVGCSSPPETADVLAADYGPPIDQPRAVYEAESWLRDWLVKPDTLKTEWSPVEQGWFGEDGWFSSVEYGYRLEGLVTWTNWYGHVERDRRFVFIFRDGRIAGVWGRTPFHSADNLERLD